MKLNVQIELKPDDINDILCTAFEGGVDYWCSGIVGSDGDLELINNGAVEIEYEYEHVGYGGKLEVHVQANNNTAMILDLENFQSGLQKWMDKNPNSVEVHHDYRNKYTTLDIGNIDAGDADCIVQYALFGKLVYG
ncbi:hypothetical protein [uncultured Mediterranean phage uvMED]|nr:hypothetical protein [uncultured Mediterranean phage uvMED]